MLDIKYIRSNADKVAWACRVKGIELDIENLLAADTALSDAKRELQSLQTQKNNIAKSFPSAKGPEQKAELQARGRVLGTEISELQNRVNDDEAELRKQLLRVPNIPAEDAPVGPDESANIVVEKVGTIPSFSFEPRDHVAILELNDWADLEGAARVSGARSYTLKNDLAVLEMALLLLAMQRLAAIGFTPITVPSLVQEAALVGTGHFPSGREDIYSLPNDNRFLAGTAEVAITSLHRDKILNQSDLPKLYLGYSPCFRREAGSAGKDVRGLLRVHQFNKIEQYVICENDAEVSQDWHKKLLDHAKNLLVDLELPFQVIECSTGDMGAGKVRMHDIETWVPSLSKYRETHSCSTIHDWQARRANLRYRNNEGNVDFVHTLNNTLVATPRILVPFLECHQQADGSVYLPEILRSFFGGKTKIGGAST